MRHRSFSHNSNSSKVASGAWGELSFSWGFRLNFQSRLLKIDPYPVLIPSLSGMCPTPFLTSLDFDSSSEHPSSRGPKSHLIRLHPYSGLTHIQPIWEYLNFWTDHDTLPSHENKTQLILYRARELSLSSSGSLIGIPRTNKSCYRKHVFLVNYM